MREEIPYGYCQCGCGEKTDIIRQDDRHFGYVKGEPFRYRPQHHSRRTPVDYVVDENGCWVWQRTINAWGYGAKSDQGRMRNAHVVYYERHVGPIPEGLQLDHLCRNRACVNPEHLEPVTHAENARRGAGCKLSWDQVEHIRSSLETGRALASRYGVTATTISDIRHFKTWREEPQAA